MREGSSYQRLAAATVLVLAIASAGPRAGQREGRTPAPPGGASAGSVPGSLSFRTGTDAPRSAFDIGYREGASRGDRDGRGGRVFSYDADRVYKSADLGYDQRLGPRETFRVEFRRGFAAGYRDSYDRTTGKSRRRVPPPYQEPAVARGYSEGYDRGWNDRHDNDRYDPVRHSDYRNADPGYQREYGSKDAYKNNYRAGFRQGYEDGYRDGARKRP